MESPFDHYSEHYKEIGLLLRSARQSMNIGVEQAAQMLHIRVRYIDALEQGRLDDLPGLPYAKGYLQTYANFLQLDKEEILRRFESVEELIGRKQFYFPQVLSKTKTPNTYAIWGGLAAALFIYAFWWLATQPKHVDLQTVEPYSASIENIGKTPSNPYDVACLRTQDVLYPPCTLKEPQYDMVPVQQGQLNSIMDLARFKTGDDAETADTEDTADTNPEADDQQPDEKPAEQPEEQPADGR